MLCPRCNSENELGAKFCRHCGAPLVDTDLYIDFKEKKRRTKEKRKQEQLERRKQQKNYLTNINQNKYLYGLFRLIKSLISLLVVIIIIYFISFYILKQYIKRTDNYNVAGDNIPSINFVLGSRDVKKIKYSYEDNSLRREYTFDNINEPGTDMIKYIAYLMEKNKFELLNEFNPTLEIGNVKLATKSSKKFDKMIVIEINWTKNSYSMYMYLTNNNLNK